VESDLRQIPDTQEVFLDPASSKSLILEVLQRVEPTEAEDAARFHFDSIAHDNDADTKNIQSIRIVPNDRGDQMPSPILLDGTQTVKKFNATVPDQIRIFMALYRVEDKNVDLLLVMNVPISTLDGGALGEQEVLAAKEEFETAALTLQIMDFGLFA
ncbi:Mog1p/PsbP-like protein, partial [Cristinia sonorae]